MAGFGISGVEPSGSAVKGLVISFHPMNPTALLQDLEIFAMKESRASTHVDK
jgi:hypothetical protein